MIIKFDNIWINNTLFILSYVIVGRNIVFKAIKNIFNGRIFDENFLMTIATIGAFLIGEFPEAVAVMLFYQIGEIFQSYAVNKSRKSITELMNIRPDYANVKRENKISKVDPNDVKVGETIIVKPGEKIPLDGIVIDGTTLIDTSSLTGEFTPKEITIESQILSGCINISGVITIKVTKRFEESTVSKILDLVENASNKKSNSENFITKFATYYTPIVVCLALILATVPPLLLNYGTFSEWIYRSLTFLVVSCPCALVISIPLGFFGGIGGASKSGILVKGSNYLEALANTEIIVFDKTGTLTKGIFEVQEVVAQDMSKEELIRLAAYAENHSNHPISLSIKKAYGEKIDNTVISDIKEIAGHGMLAIVEGIRVLVGNTKLLDKFNISYPKLDISGTIVFVAINEKYAGYIVIYDGIKDDSKDAIVSLKNDGVKQIIMLTGDAKNVAENVANSLNIDKVYSDLLPTDKVEKLEEIFKLKSPRGKLAFVGDGINDAPVLARADIGIAMGGLGSDAAIEAADIVIMTDEPSKIVTAINISKKTIRIVKQNISFALLVKVGVLILSAFGISTMWEAVFADVGVSVLAILNALRVLQYKKDNK
ncbi:MAG: heavy metal translocating P-type ATPase [Clostridia bacterium]|nr:heavy metal translocating P-type ATPase [Clostridia bacterium]